MLKRESKAECQILYDSSKKVYKYIFWVGYFSVMITALLPVTGELNKINIGPEAFHIRLDHLLHLIVYFLICMYYLFGHLKGFPLFEKNSQRKFVLLILILAIVTEVVQFWVPERAFNVFDLVFNFAGVVIGVILNMMVLKCQGIKA
jgi:VanZ family protein